MQSASVNTIDKNLPDAEIARRIADGDKDALLLVIRRCNQTLYRTARSILKDEAEAEDAVQEAYLLAYRAMGGFRGDAKLSTWLVRIVVNEALGRMRKRTRRAEVIQLDVGTNQNEEAAEVNIGEISPEQPEHAALRSETHRLIESKIDLLPDKFRTVLVLRALEEMTVEEVAVCLSIPQVTVRTRYFRAKGLLRKALAREIDVSFQDAFTFAGERCARTAAAVLDRLKSLQARDA